MSEHEPQAFRELFDAEPAGAPESETAKWVDLYERLIAMMERQLEETRVFAKDSPDAMKEYLGGENIAILTEEIDAFKKRLARWNGPGQEPR